MSSRPLFCAYVLLLLVGIMTVTAKVVAQQVQPLTDAQLFESQELLDVQITIAESDWKELASQTVDFVTAFSKGPVENNYKYVPGEITINGRHLAKVELRKKGFFGSMDSLRPSLKVKIEDEADKRLVAGLERLTLNNNKQDRANVSQLIAYKLFREAGLPAPRCCLAKVSVNGRPLGIYTHVESIEKPFLERTFGNDSGKLYEGVFPTDFLADRLDRFQIKQGKKDLKEIRQVTLLLENPPADLATELNELIDIDEFINYWALESLIGFWDGYAANQNNYYLYKNPGDSKLHFIPWGADMTLMPPFFPGAAANKSVYAKGLLAYQLNQDPQIRERYHAAMLHLLENVWREDDLLAEVDRIEKLVKDHLHPAQGDVAQAADTARTFIKNRRQDIMNETQDGPIHITTPPAKPFYMREVGEATASFSAEWVPLDGGENKPSDQVHLELTLNGDKIQFEQLAATAGPARFPSFGGPGPQGPPPPTVVLTGVRQSDQKKMTLTIVFNGDQFAETGAKAKPVQGMLMEGETFMFGAGMRSFVGKVELTSAGQDAGSIIAGSVAGKLYEMRGFMGR